MDTSTCFIFLLIFPVFQFKTIRPRQICTDELKDQCTCESTWFDDRADVYVTNCTNANFTNGRVLGNIPLLTEVLIFVGNDLRYLPENVFGQLVQFQELREIDLSRNNIQSIHERSFSRNEKRVQKLILNDNDLIPKSGADIFSNFDHLRELYLSNAFSGNDRLKLISAMIFASERSLISLQLLDISDNELIDFENNDFLCSLPNLHILNLSKNKLTQFTLSARCIPSLKSLDLSQNQIVTLNQQSMTLIETLIDTRLNLNENPFNCNCNSIEMISWWQNTTAGLLAPATCSSPKTWADKYLDSIDVKQIECAGSRLNLNMSGVISIILLCLFWMS